jgi:PAS domain S-box-containing protein
MDWRATLFFVLILLTFLLTTFLAWYAFKSQKLAGVRAYALLALAESFVSLSEILSMVSPQQTQAQFWFNIRFLPNAFLPVIFVVFAFRYNSHDQWLSKKIIGALSVIPILTQVMVWTNSQHHLWLVKDVLFNHINWFWIADIGARVPSLWFLVHTMYSILLMVTGISVLFLTAWQNRHKARGQSILLTLGALIGLVLLVITTFNLLPTMTFNIFTPGLGLTALLYALAILRFDFLKASSSQLSKKEPTQLPAYDTRSFALFFIIFIITASGIFAIGYLSYRQYMTRYLENSSQQLDSIAKLKVRSLLEWREERTADMRSITQNVNFARLVDQYLHTTAKSTVGAEIQDWIESVKGVNNYERIILLDSEGNLLASTMTTDSGVPGHITAYLQTDRLPTEITWIDFHRHEDGSIRLAILSPIFLQTDVSVPLGMLVFEISPEQWLYPYLQTWPLSSSTAETLLVEDDGDAALFLTPVRFNPDASLKLKIPLTDSRVLAVKGVIGIRGVVEGLDYRGREVIGSIQEVPNSPWILIARMDKEDVYAPLKTRLWQTVLFFGILIIASGSGLTMIWRNNRFRFLQNQLSLTEQIKQSEEKFRKAFSTSPDAMVITRMRDGLIVLYNEAFLRILGYTDEDVYGKNSFQLNIWERVQDREKIIEELKKNGRVTNFAARFRKKSGDYIYGLMSASLIEISGELHILNTTRDVTEQKNAEMQLSETRDYLNNLITFANAPIITWDAHKKITTSNKALEQLTGYQADEVLGRKIDFLFPEGERKDSIEKINRAVSGEYLESVEIPIKRKNGETRVGLWNSANIYSSDGKKLVATIAQGQDITERKQMELKLKEHMEHLEELVDTRTHDLKKVQERALRQERLATLGQLAGSIAHELRNPLGVISNATTYLSIIQPKADPKVLEYLEIIKSETKTSEKIITDLLDYTHLQVTERAIIQVNALVQNSLRRFPQPKNVELIAHISENLPSVYVNGTQLEQVLGNLLTNAYQALPKGGKVTLAAELFTGEDQKGNKVRISVADNGEGIRPENLGLIFEPLFTTKAKGIGLGLPLCKKFVEANKGEISVTSKVHEGATFILVLPTEMEDL